MVVLRMVLFFANVRASLGRHPILTARNEGQKALFALTSAWQFAARKLSFDTFA